MPFDPDAYLANKIQAPAFDPDAYLAAKNPQLFSPEAQQSIAKTNQFVDQGGLQEIYRDLPFESVASVKKQLQRGGADRPELEHLILREKSRLQGIPLVRDLPEIGDSPEMSKFDMPAFKASLGANFTMRDEEMGNILAKQFGAKIGQDIEGNYYATMPSGGSYAINRPGLSGQDIAKGVSMIGAFTPAGRSQSLLGMSAGGMATQAVIEGGQTALGGEFNPGDVAMAGAAPIVLNKATQAIKYALKPLTSRPPVVTQYIDDQLQPQVSQQSTVRPSWDIKEPIQESVKRAEIRQAINAGTVEGAGWRIDPKTGKIVADKLSRDLVKKGISEKLVVAPNTMTRGTKEASRKMLQKAENFIRGVKGSERDIPQSVIGESAMKRFDVIKKAQAEASKKIGEAVRTDLKNKPVNIQTVIDEFDDDLARLGVRLTDEGKLDFSQSLIQRSNTTPIKDVYARLKANYSDAAELHDLKRYISKQIDYGKSSPLVRTLDDDAEAALKAVRAKINANLQDMSPAYKAANKEFSDAAQTIVPFAKEMGRRFDPESMRVDSLVGQELRKTITNYAKANDLIEALDNLDATARQFGGQFDDDIMTQVMFNAELQKAFGSFKPGSMQGVIESGTDVALSRAGLTGQAAKAGLNAAKDRFIFNPPSKEELELIKQLKELVNR